LDVIQSDTGERLFPLHLQLGLFRNAAFSLGQNFRVAVYTPPKVTKDGKAQKDKEEVGC